MQKKSKKVSDFQIMDKIAGEGSADGIAMFPNLLKGNLTEKGGTVTFGVPADAIQWTLRGSHYFVLYAIKKEDFARVESELKTQTSWETNAKAWKIKADKWDALDDEIGKYYQDETAKNSMTTKAELLLKLARPQPWHLDIYRPLLSHTKIII
jgi:hypothetical protein